MTERPQTHTVWLRPGVYRQLLDVLDAERKRRHDPDLSIDQLLVEMLDRAAKEN